MRRIAATCAALALGACAPNSAPVASSAQDDSGLPKLRVPSASEADRADGGPAPGTVLTREDWTFAGRDGVVLTTPRYRVLTTLGPSVLRERVPIFLERALLHYTSAVVELPMPQRPMESFVMANRTQWVELTRRLVGPRAALYERIQRGGYATQGRGVFFDIGEHDTLQIAGHEGWHQYTQATFGHRLPSWLEEGVACYMEGFRWHPTRRDVPVFLPWANTERFDLLRRLASRGQLSSLAEITGTTADERVRGPGSQTLAFYAQVWALVHFLAEGEGGVHRAAFEQILKDAADGTLFQTLQAELGRGEAGRAFLLHRGDAILRAYLGRSAEQLDPAYQAFISRITQPGSRNAIVAGRSPLRGP